MPLTTLADLGHHNKKRDIVRFFMQNETKERIRCGVTNHALEVFKLDFDRRTDDPLTTFNKYRPTSRVRRAPSTIDKTLNLRMGRPFS